MGLIRKLTIHSVSKDGTEINIQDTTGSYSSTNQGGYGTPNPALASAVLLYLLVQRYDESVYFLGKKEGANINTVLTSSSYPLSQTDLGQTTKSAFPDGVLKVSSFLLYASVAATLGSTGKSITGANLSTVKIADAIAVVDAEGNPHFYYINKDKLNTDAEVFLVAEADVTNFTAVYPVYVGSEFTLNQATGEKVLIEKIGEYAETNDLCRKTEEELNSLYMQKIGAEVKFSCKNYSAADLIASSLSVRAQLLSCYR